MRFPIVSRRRLVAVEADRERIRSKYDEAVADLAAAMAAAKTAARQFDEADRALSAARKQLNEQLPDAIAAHEARRKGLAAAVGLSENASWYEATTEAAALRTRLAQARTALATLGAELADLREDGRAVDGGTVQARTVSAETRRERARADALAARLAELTAANQNCTCGGVS